ncbi:ATP-binding protein [Congregibacter variabilis]|uniref:histidine kinase n=1 Tax=Congregibacter variabilis TaxID=3081200 RepID=A0ABZ0I2J2_9GAMM|nr:ATP-binding protein [Congregibacter sp. IMCC43200]
MAINQKRSEIDEMEALLANLPGTVYRCVNNRDWSMEYASAGVYRLCGYPASALLEGRPDWGDIIHVEDRERTWRTVQEAVAQDKSFEVFYRIQTPNGALRWVCDRGCRVSSNHEVSRIEGFLMDFTQELEAQGQLRAQQVQLAEINRLESLKEIMTGIAHEINQPLAAISSYAQSALHFVDMEEFKRDRIQDALIKIKGQTQRASAVVERIRDLAQTGLQRNERVDCNALLTRIRDLIEPRARMKRNHIGLDLTDADSSVWGDPVQLEQLMLNLVRNAMDATERQADFQRPEILLRTSVEDGHGIRLSVIDSGRGLSAVQAEGLFRPFGTDQGSRIKLGLAVARSIAEAHHGQLNYCQNPTQGATFYVTLPLCKGRK